MSFREERERIQANGFQTLFEYLFVIIRYFERYSRRNNTRSPTGLVVKEQRNYIQKRNGVQSSIQPKSRKCLLQGTLSPVDFEQYDTGIHHDITILCTHGPRLKMDKIKHLIFYSFSMYVKQMLLKSTGYRGYPTCFFSHLEYQGTCCQLGIVEGES